MAERFLIGYRQLGRLDDGINLLRGYLARYPSLDMLNTVFQAILDRDGPGRANELVRDELRKAPTLLGLDKLLEAQLLEAPARAAPRSGIDPQSGASTHAQPRPVSL